MKDAKHTLSANPFLLIPKEPVLDFGTIELDHPSTPQTFTIELAPDVQRAVTTDADFLSIKPPTFRRGQTTIHVSPIPERLEKGRQYQTHITVAANGRQRQIPVSVKVRRYNDLDIYKVISRLDALSQQVGQQRD